MEKTASNDLVSIDIVASIHEVRAGEWNALAGAYDFYQSYEWLAALERDSTARSRYLLASLSGRLVGALPIYQVGFEGNPFYRAERFRALLGVKGRYLIAGARRCYRSNVTLAPQLPAAVQDQVTGALLRAALAAAAEDGMSGIALFYLSTPALEHIGRVVPVAASFDSAETIIEGIGAGIDAYLSRLSSKRRSKIRREMRIFAATGWHTDVPRLADCLSEVASLVSKVGQRHGHPTPNILLRRVFRQQAEAADHRSVVFTCRDGAGDMVACAVNYIWRDTLYSRAAGLDYDRIGGSFAYFNLLIIKAIEYAAEHGLDRLHLGLASSAKIERGAMASPLWTAAVDAGAPGRGPGIRLVNPGAMQCWSEPYRCYSHAFPAETWALPEADHSL